MNRILTGLAIGAAVTAGGLGAYLATGGADAASAPPTSASAFHPCPDDGPIGELSPGDRVFLTGRSDDGTWVELRAPSDLDARVWMRASSVAPDAALDDLAVREPDCERAEVLVAGPAAEAPDDDLTEDVDDDEGPDDLDGADDPGTAEDDAGPEATTPQPTPGTAPAPGAEPAPTPSPAPSPSPSPSPGPSPTPPPQEPEPQPAPTEPSLTFVSRSAPQIREAAAANVGACDTSLPTTSSLTVQATHPSGIASVELRSRIDGGAWTAWSPMSSVLSGPADRYRRALGPYQPSSNGIAPFEKGVITWQARATPVEGPSVTSSSTANSQVELLWCDFA